MDFCFAVYILKVQSCCLRNISHEEIINLILWFYITEAKITGKTGEFIDIDKSTASKLVNRRINLPRVIRNGLRNKNTTDEKLISHFKEKIIPELNPNTIDKVVKEIQTLLNGCSEIISENKDKLSQNVQNKEYAEFLAIAFKYTLTLPNKLPQNIKSDDEIEKEQAPKKKTETSKNKATVPAAIQKNEMPYLKAIADAISEKEKSSLSIDELKKNKKYGKRIEHHRNEFFSADYVRRQAREIYDENEDAFGELQEEVKDGIYYTVERQYENGYERLNSTLEQAAHISLESTALCKNTDLVTMKAKQGICHTLINDKKLEGWTNDKYN